MSFKWSKKSALANAPSINDWPEFDESGLSTEDQEFIRNRKKAVKMVMANLTYAEIKNVTGINSLTVRKLTSICLAQAPDGQIMGFRGLLPFTRLSGNVRRSDIEPKRKHQQGGMSCALQATLARFPTLFDKLRARILKEKRGGVIPESKIRGVTLHRIFLEELKKLGVTENQWPFTAEYKGIRSITK